MTDEIFQEWGTFAALMLLGPYIIGIPLTIAWALIAALVEWLTGWGGLMPADVRHNANSARNR